MNNFELISTQELQDNISGGGFISCVAGGLAGGMIGAFVGIIPSVATGNPKYMKQSIVAGATTGFWVGAGCPLP